MKVKKKAVKKVPANMKKAGHLANWTGPSKHQAKARAKKKKK